jgi:hypothetical protein
MSPALLRLPFPLASIAAPLLGLATFAWPAIDARAATRVVSNCNDSGSGSLRNAVAGALSGDTIDLRGLGCSRIILTSGQITIPQAALTLRGRDRYELTIDGNRGDRVFLHTGTSTLRLERVSIAYGLRSPVDVGNDFGGCIRSDGNLELHRARVHGCAVQAGGFIDSPSTFGGGISALGNVLLSYSAVFNNSATADGTGGGIFAGGRVTLYRSQVYNNFSFLAGGVLASQGATVTYSLIHNTRASSSGAGLSVIRPSTDRELPTDLIVNKSTISNNVLDDFQGRNFGGRGGGIYISGTGPRTITDSTISGNRAHLHSAASIAGDADIYNSTIAFNVEIETIDQEFATIPCENRGALTANVLHLESTIVAKNTCTIGPASYDIAGSAAAVIGADNLIGRSRIPVPPDTISADPRLAPLAENGGPTRTNALLSDSPAINRGSNLLNRAYDQRGPGFPRVKGAFPDIGAIER